MSSRAATFIVKLLAASEQSQINDDPFRISDIFILSIFTPSVDSRVSGSCRARHADMMTKRLILGSHLSGGGLNAYTRVLSRAKTNRALVPGTPVEAR